MMMLFQEVEGDAGLYSLLYHYMESERLSHTGTENS